MAVINIAEGKGLMTPEKSGKLIGLIEKGADTSVARSVAIDPSVFENLSLDQLDKVGAYVHMPMRVSEVLGESAETFSDYTWVCPDYNNGYTQKVEVYGGQMVLQLLIECETNDASFDFVPRSSLGALHAFDSRLIRELTQDTKLQAKLDITNALIVLAQSGELATDRSQLIASPAWPGDENTARFEHIARIDTLKSNKTNETFSNYLKHKCGFELISTSYGHTVEISMDRLKESLPKLFEIRSDYPGRIINRERESANLKA